MCHKKERGVSLIAAIFVVIFLAFMGIILTTYTISAAEEAGNEYLSTQALFYADTGIYNALTDITDDGNLDVSSYTFSNPTGTATITVASHTGSIWVLDCTATCGDTASEKYGRRTIRVTFKN
ncbi:MAG: hypothetical protein DRJ08_06660 [Acidobacteria bacterium]|nr:MAG: hypothetical protein DRJ14_04695 [Acidobacteriota bacterium]RLE20664.1 MAG: hypothetical protein DRJ08_06660 [Acidobacteriota bacterium]